MRKSIFLTTILALFSLFVGLEQASAQTTPTTPDKNKNKIGVKHSFEVAISTAEKYKGDGLFNWYITSNVSNLLKEDVAFAAGTGTAPDTEGVFDSTNNYFSIDNTDGGSEYHKKDMSEKTATSKKLTLTWKPEAIFKKDKYYLVLNYSEQATGASCVMNNIKVLKIEPINAFNLEVVAADEDGNEITDKNLCAAKVKSATIVGSELKVLYQNTTLYYKITASGFTGKWRPTINLPELKGITVDDGTNAIKRKYTSIQWKQLDGTDTYKKFKNSWTEGGGVQENLVADGVANVSTESSVTTEQNSILVKIVIDNGTYEGLVKEDINFAAKGNMTKEVSGESVSVEVRDVDTETNGYKALTTDRNDTSVLLARPTITSTSGEFITVIK